jgi:hypothetical protein
VKKWFVNAGGDVGYLGPAPLGCFMTNEIANFKAIAKEARLKLE